MQIQFAQLVSHFTALAAGATIGLGFGFVQEMAARRHERLQKTGKLNSGWALIPGSMRRTGYLLMALAGVQLICPLLFNDGCQWWVSGGVIAGYGWALWRKLRQSMAAARVR